MINIGQFFKKIQNKHTKELFVRSIIKDALKKYTQLDVPVEAMSFSSNSLVLKNISQVAKSQIFIKKQLILQEINTAQSIKIISDIR